MQQIVMDLKKMSSNSQYGLFEVLEKINDYCLKVGIELKDIHTYAAMVDRLENMSRNKTEYYDKFAVALNQNKESQIFYCKFNQWENVKKNDKYVPLFLPIHDKGQLVDIAIKQLHLN